jgi:fructose-1,6-bisphosphatase I
MEYRQLYGAFKTIAGLLRNNDVMYLGSDTNEINTSNDVKKNIDLLANDAIVSSLKNIDSVIGYISEEEEELVLLEKKKHCKNGTIIIFDPLDGSKNVMSNITVGTIYGIYNYDVENDKIIDIIETGYSLYGPSTQLVRTVNKEKVVLYHLGEDNEFHEIKTLSKPSDNSVYSINMSYEYEKDVEYFIHTMKQDGCTQRWCGAMVADAHQVIIRGGTFIYPSSTKMKKGKIRFLYEALPLSYLFTLLDCVAVDINIMPILNRISFMKLSDCDIHGETPIILSTYYDNKELRNIFELNDLIKC